MSGCASAALSEQWRENGMNDQWLSLAADPRLIEIALCIGVIAILQWIELIQ
jgi:hypothetical protein